MRYGSARQLLLPSAAVALASFFLLRQPGLGGWLDREGRAPMQAALWLAAFWLVNRLIRVFLWQRRVKNLAGSAAPLLLQHVVTLALLTVACAGIAQFVYGMPVASVWAASTAVGLVLGVALRSLIADLFSGIALELDPPFQIGDYIELHKSAQETISGQVVEVNWRATQVRLRGQTGTVYIPNSVLSAAPVLNSYEPLNRSRFEVLVSLDATLGAERAERALLTAALLAEGVLAEPAPEALLHQLTNAGVQYKVRYWLAPETAPDLARHAVLSALLEQIQQSGLSLAYEKREVALSRKTQSPADSRARKMNCARRIALFHAFDAAELEQLVDSMRTVHIPARRPVIQAGDPGTSMYLVAEGVLHALVSAAEGQPAITVGKLAPGDFFGEMSLLTGEARSATVVSATDAVLYEMSREGLQGLLTRRPEVAEQLSHVAADRHIENLKLEAAAHAGGMLEEHHRLKEQILARMRSFFALLS